MASRRPATDHNRTKNGKFTDAYMPHLTSMDWYAYHNPGNQAFTWVIVKPAAAFVMN